MNKFAKIIATLGPLGYLPVPGTIGSLAAFLIIVPFFSYLPYITPVLIAVGVLIAKPSQKILGQKDPKCFVWDEVCGMCLSVLWLPNDVAVLITAFLMFRLLDATKPWPIYLFERIKGPGAILWDDLAAGVAANLILQAALRLI